MLARSELVITILLGLFSLAIPAHALPSDKSQSRISPTVANQSLQDSTTLAQAPLSYPLANSSTPSESSSIPAQNSSTPAQSSSILAQAPASSHVQNSSTLTQAPAPSHVQNSTSAPLNSVPQGTTQKTTSKAQSSPQSSIQAAPQGQQQSSQQSSSLKQSNSQSSSLNSSPEICTDRPSVTPSPLVVPQNYFQAENGIALRKEHSGGTFNAAQTQLRLGVLKRAELRMAVPNYFLTRGSAQDVSGVADMSVGTKIQLGPLPGNFQMAIIPGLTLPTGSKALSSNGVDPFVQLTAAHSLSTNWSIGSAHSIFIHTEAAETQVQGITSTRKNVIYQPTCILSRRLGPHADYFLEYAGNFTRYKLSDQIIDTGAVYRFKRNQQIGIRCGVGLTKASSTAFVEFGYAFLLGKIIR